MKPTDYRSPTHRVIRFSDVPPCQTCPQSGQCPLPTVGAESTVAFQPLMRLKPGEPLFHSGESFRYLYATRGGLLARWQVADKQRPTVVGFYLPSEIAGLGGFADSYYRFTTVAIEPTMVCPVEPEALAATDPPLGMRALRSAMALQAEVDAHQHRYLKVADPEQKLADCLKSLRQRRERVALRPGEQLCVPAPLIASHLGLNVATVRGLVTHNAADQVPP